MSSSEPDSLRAAADAMAAVRSRCVWSQEMTHESLLPYLTEESAELIEAVEVGDRAELREELGDLLWQVLFHAAVAADDPTDPFTIDDVAQALTEKMVRRHPHVFGDVTAATPEEVLVHWNAAKAAEKSSRTSVLDGVAPEMSAIARAQKVLGKAASVGVSLATEDADVPDETALGEQLLTLVAAARANGLDAERALRQATRALEAEVRATED